MKAIFDLLIQQYLFDVQVLSQPWMYYWLLIPALFYVNFMFIKWAVLTMPIWVSFYIMLNIYNDQQTKIQTMERFYDTRKNR
jgi:hypothetical protein